MGKYTMQTRENALHLFIKNTLNDDSYTCKSVAGDASFRRYFRVQNKDSSFIIMDAPPDKESTQPFIHIAEILLKNEISAPKILAKDVTQGFLLLEDFGDALLLKCLTPQNSQSLYESAIKTLVQIQKFNSLDPQIKPFDEAHMHQEMGLFTTWFLEGYLKITPTTSEKEALTACMSWLAKSLVNQPQVFIHRDYHSRNLLLLNNTPPYRLGVIDFQDAMHGPIGYDLVSLLKDCYYKLPRPQVEVLVSHFKALTPTLNHLSEKDFLEAFDMCGVQRHLKVLGVFSRLYLRDNKPQYLDDLPLTLYYLLETTEQYAKLQPLHTFLNKRVSLP